MKVRSDILKVYRSLHTWVGITTGLLLFIGFFAGALTMFKQPVDRWISPPEQRLPWVDTAQLDSLVALTLQQHQDARQEFSLYPIEREDLAAPIQWSESGGGRGLKLSEARNIASLDAQGQLVTESLTPSLFGELVDMLHRTGGIPGDFDGEYVGIWILGVAAVLYFLALVSGLILLLPTLVKDFFALRRGKNNKRFWLDAHNVVGITSLPFHIVISLTVIVFAFHDQFYDALRDVVYPVSAPPANTAPAPAYSADRLLPPSELIARARTEAPDFAVTELLYLGLESSRPFVRVSIYNPAALVHGPVTGYMGMNPYTGELLMTSMLPGKAEGWGAIVNYFFALHFGSFGGDLVRWIYFCLGLGGAFLFYSGNLLWIETRRKKLRKTDTDIPRQPRNLRWMAAGTVGVCFGSIIGICLAMAAGKWASGLAFNINHIYLWVYYFSFLLTVTYAFWRGAGRATWQLLAACAASCVLIPGTTLVAVVAPASGLWANTSAGAVAVDATALGFALVFTCAAIHNRKRALHGGRDSVWATADANAGAEPKSNRVDASAGSEEVTA
ncbi:PepSY-associated TM helix domain-containing protein [Microbulbifer aggregans]|uniref:PepSY-associated TM helix domain-containing protein n=1 Tax=Microbulbifer aggregans TaxID=1769779 RepID=UPI001CFD4AF5|nr:PepSY-associated TM helix domain-containing protein [Microbulbifer aggregans]